MTTERIRGRKLQRIRNAVLSREPLCRACHAKGRYTPAAELDHIIPLHAGGTNDVSNLQPLCRECHQAKTARDMGYRERVTIGADGWPIEGASSWGD